MGHGKRRVTYNIRGLLRMKSYKVTVYKSGTLVYPEIEVLAENEEDAEEKALHETCEMDDRKAFLSIKDTYCEIV